MKLSPFTWYAIAAYPMIGWLLPGSLLLRGSILMICAVPMFVEIKKTFRTDDCGSSFLVWGVASFCVPVALLLLLLRVPGGPEYISRCLQLDSIWYSAWLTAIGAATEELVFRGLIQGFLLKRMRSAPLSITATAAIFAVAHFGGNSILLFIYGIFLGALCYFSKSLLHSFLLHFVYNICVVIGKAQIELVRAATDPAVQYDMLMTSFGSFALTAMLYPMAFLYLVWKYWSDKSNSRSESPR